MRVGGPLRRRTARQRGEIDRCAFCLEPCALGTGLDPSRSGCPGGAPGGLATCRQCGHSTHYECWGQYRRECFKAKIKVPDPARQDMNAEELRQEMCRWFPCPTCRACGPMALWPKPRKKSLAQQVRDAERAIRGDGAFLLEVCRMLAIETDTHVRTVLHSVQTSLHESLCRRRCDLDRLRDERETTQMRSLLHEGRISDPCLGM